MSSTPTIARAPELAADYYLRNFHALLRWIEDRYNDLQTAAGRDFLRKFAALPHPSQCLLVRMLCRKGDYFRADKLHYPEVGPTACAARPLLKAGLILADPELAVNEVGALLTRAEIRDVFGSSLPKTTGLRKTEIVAQLTAGHPDVKPWSNWTAAFGELYELHCQPAFNRCLLLFFGNTGQDLTDFVLTDLGLVRFENYTIDTGHRLFDSEQEIDQLIQLTQLREQLESVATFTAWQAIAEAIPLPTQHPLLRRKAARLRYRLGYKMEQQGHLEAALALYERCHLAPARERRVRTLVKLGREQQAWELLQTLLGTPLCEQEHQAAARIARRLARKLKIPLCLPKLPPLPTQKLLLPPREKASERIEECVRRIYARELRPCYFVENSLFVGLFGLWLWPQLFASVQGAFAHPFQDAPLDLYEPEFAARRPQLQTLWAQFHDATYAEQIRLNWDRHFGKANPFVAWHFLDFPLLDLALTIVPAKHLKGIFQRLLFDPKSNRSGLPDLIQFDLRASTYQLVEVKGPGDRLQDNQLRWLEYFQRQDIPASVTYVEIQ